MQKKNSKILMQDTFPTALLSNNKVVQPQNQTKSHLPYESTNGS